MVITGYFTYRIFTTYKAHFTRKKFDISKYNGGYLKPSYESFIQQRGVHFFDALAKKAKTEKQLVNVLICAFIKDPTLWVKDIVENYSYYKKLASKWESTINNLPYTFEQDCLYLMERGLAFDENLGTFILGEFCNGNIKVETFIIFNKIFHFSLDKDPNFEYIYYSKYHKYEKLVQLDNEKYKVILEEVLKCNR